jgi:hypothetical protein
VPVARDVRCAIRRLVNLTVERNRERIARFLVRILRGMAETIYRGYGVVQRREFGRRSAPLGDSKPYRGRVVNPQAFHNFSQCQMP